MPPYVYDETGRRVVAPTKRERREQAILAAADQQLVELGADAMTVESIATAAGIGRAALYRYFRSKNDVLAALVRRATDELTTGVATSGRAEELPPDLAIREALRRTALLWAAHGAVLRAAVELSATVATVAQPWDAAREEVERDALRIVADRLTENGDAARGPAMVHALVAMTERELYTASSAGRDLDPVVDVLGELWVRGLRL